jgi:phosphopantetheinyl transferase
LQLLTQLLPARLAGSVELACCKVADRYSENVLSRHEKKVWNSFGSLSRRREYLSSRWLIRKMAEQMKLDPDSFYIRKEENGRPFGMYKSQKYFISIAHTSGRTVCAISASLSVGIDLEPQNRPVSEQLHSRLLNESEQSFLAGEDIIRLWTLKEAILKLYGSGLRTRLKDWVIISRNNTSFTAEYEHTEQVKIFSFSHQNNWIAIAYKPS